MTDKVRKYYNEAKNDLVFQETLKNNGEEMYKPSWTWGEFEKHFYAAVYIGYLHGNGEYESFKILNDIS